MRSQLFYLLKIFVVFAAYYLTASWGLHLGAVSGFATFIWPPTGIALASVFLFGYRVWPAIFAAAFLINLNTGAPLFSAFGMGLGNLLEALTGVYLFRRFNFRDDFLFIKDVVGFVAISALGATMIAATFGVSSLLLGGVIDLSAYFKTWIAWWVGDALGALVIVPFVLVWAKALKKHLKPKDLFYIALASIFLIAINSVIFLSILGAGFSESPFLYLVFLPLIFSAIVLNMRGATAAIIITSAFAIAGTIYGLGPFALGELSARLFYLQTYMGVVAGVILVLAAAISEIRIRDRELSVKLDAMVTERTLSLNEAQNIAHVGNFDWNIPQNKVTWSDELYRIYGLEPGEFKATYEGFLERVHPDSRDKIRGLLEEAYRAGNSFEFEEKIVRPNGAIRVLYTRGNVVRDENGRAVKMSGVCRDVTDEKKDKEELTAKVAELEKIRRATLNLLEDLNKAKLEVERAKTEDDAIISSVGDGLVFSDKNGLVTLVNRKMESMLGVKSASLVGKSLFEVVKIQNAEGKDLPVYQRPGNITITTKERYTTSPIITAASVLYMVSRNGAKFPIAVTATPVIVEGELLGIVETFRDISIEVETERVKTEFVSIASHQLRTPLATINWYTEMLLAGDAGKMSKGQEEYLHEIYRGNQRMIALVNSLLNVSRLEVGSFLIEPSEIDLASVVEDITKDNEAVAVAKNIKITSSISKSVPKVSADPNLLRIIFQNLVSNAIKYTPHDGKVSVDISWEADVHVDKVDRKNKGGVLIKISDTGMGIPISQRDKIFTKLFRADNARESDPEGTGLGLYIIRSIIDQTAGEIWFDSEEGRGTTFYILAPANWMRPRMGTRRIVEEKQSEEKQSIV